MNKALELAKQAGAVSYTNRHYPDRPYRTFGPEELQKFYTLARADLEAENAKLLAGVDNHRWKVLDLLPRGSEELDEAIVDYAAAAAAQARMKALDEAVGICERFANRMMTAEECAAAIESLKEKV